MAISKIGTHIKVSNFKKSRAFYDALGFKVQFEFGPGLPATKTSAPEDYSGTSYATPDGTAILEIGEGHPAVKPEVFKEPIKSSKVSLMVHVNSIEEVLERATKAGIAVAKEPVNYSWGTTEVVFRDPDGFILVFITPTTEKYKKTYPNIAHK